SRENNITVEPADIHEFARQQLFGYMGMPAGGEEQPWIAEYVTRMMQDKKFVEDAYHRIQMDKLFVWAETQVNPVDKPISVEDFSKEVEKHQHHHH
ncbi:MAG TPA: trigger factor, partial [Chitinophagaceae bacterium]|nr:trigger factor [Chitinophagaceae bacterium]